MKTFEKFEHEVARGLDSFRHVWRLVTKQQKGDVVSWQGNKYKIEDVKEDFKDGENLYTLCRFESEDGINLKLSCLKILAKPGELE